MFLKEITIEQFEYFLSNHNYNSIYQTSEYTLAMKNQGYTPMFLGLFDNGDIIASTAILIENKNGFKYAYASRGFLINYEDLELVKIFTDLIKKYLSKKDIVAIKISPMIIKNIYNSKKELVYHNEHFNNIYINLKKLGYYHYGYNNYFESLKPRFEAVLDLDKPYYDTFRNIKKNFKTKIRNAEKSGIKVYRGDINNITDLYIHTKRKYPKDNYYFADIFNNFSKKDNAYLYYTKLDTKEYLIKCQNLYQQQEEYNLNLDNSILLNNNKNNDKLITKKIAADNLLEKIKKQLMIATNMLKENPDGIITSSVLILTNKDTVYLYMDGYDKKYQFLNSKHLLLWKIIEKYSLQGFKKFNLGGVINIFSSNERYNGLNEFKLSFDPDIIEYVGDMELICNNTLYFMYKNNIKNILKK